MPLKKLADRRVLEMSFDLPGTPEQIWQAIATGPGISSWFVPTTVEEHVGGAVAFVLGEDMTSTGHVTAWNPPHRYAIEEPGWSGDAPPLATEFIIETHAGGTCTVRLVHSLFTSSDEWDDQIGSMETGWPPFFEVLRLILANFPGQQSAVMRLTAQHPGPESAAWRTLEHGLQLTGASVGQRRLAPAGAPIFEGVVERADNRPAGRELIVRLVAPGPGIALISVFTWEAKVQIGISLYFYGDNANAILEREEPAWRAWLNKRFPGPGLTGRPSD